MQIFDNFKVFNQSAAAMKATANQRKSCIETTKEIDKENSNLQIAKKWNIMIIFDIENRLRVKEMAWTGN